jgi:hypothetical protein
MAESSSISRRADKLTAAGNQIKLRIRMVCAPSVAPLGLSPFFLIRFDIISFE